MHEHGLSCAVSKNEWGRLVFLPFVAIATSVDLLKRIHSMDHITHFCWQALIGRIVDRPFKKLSARGLVTPLFYYLDENSVVLERVTSAEPL